MVERFRGSSSCAMLMRVVLLSIGVALASCSAPPDLSKTSDSEQGEPVGAPAPQAPPSDVAESEPSARPPAGGSYDPGIAADDGGEVDPQLAERAKREAEREREMRQAEEADRDAAARYEPSPPPPPPGAGQGAPPPAPQAQNAPPTDSGFGRSVAARPPKKSAEARPMEAAPPDPVGGAPAPRLEPAPSADEPPGPGRRGLGEAERPRSAAPTASAPPADDAAKEFDVVPVFYGTDRAVEPDDARLKYGPERGLKLQLGRAMITVPTLHKVPNIERPWVVEIPYFKVKVWEQKEDPAKHFTVQEIGALSEDELLAKVRERLASSATFKDHAIVFVHGFNTSFDNALYRTAQIAYDLKFDGAPFVYSWPSGGKVASYTYDRGSAEQAEPYLEEFLKLVVEKSGAKSISLIAHSMGNELLLRVLERARPAAPDGVTISQVILAAPDVDKNKFANIARKITTFSKGVTLYAASNDRALGYSARFWGGVPRAGDVPATGPTIVEGVDTIDVTAISTDGLGLNHSGYAENPDLLNDVKALIQNGVRPPDKREKKLLTVESPLGVYWRYQPSPP